MKKTYKYQLNTFDFILGMMLWSLYAMSLVAGATRSLRREEDYSPAVRTLIDLHEKWPLNRLDLASYDEKELFDLSTYFLSQGDVIEDTREVLPDHELGLMAWTELMSRNEIPPLGEIVSVRELDRIGLGFSHESTILSMAYKMGNKFQEIIAEKGYPEQSYLTKAREERQSHYLDRSTKITSDMFLNHLLEDIAMILVVGNPHKVVDDHSSHDFSSKMMTRVLKSAFRQIDDTQAIHGYVHPIFFTAKNLMNLLIESGYKKYQADQQQNSASSKEEKRFPVEIAAAIGVALISMMVLLYKTRGKHSVKKQREFAQVTDEETFAPKIRHRRAPKVYEVITVAPPVEVRPMKRKSPNEADEKLFKKKYHEIFDHLKDNDYVFNKTKIIEALTNQKIDFFDFDAEVPELNLKALRDFIYSYAKPPKNSAPDLMPLPEERIPLQVRPVVVAPPAIPPMIEKGKGKAVEQRVIFVRPDAAREYEAFLEAKADLIDLCQEIHAFAEDSDENKHVIKGRVNLKHLAIIRHGLVHLDIFYDRDPSQKLAFCRLILLQLKRVWPLGPDGPSTPLSLECQDEMYQLFAANQIAWQIEPSRNMQKNIEEGQNLIKARQAALEQNPGISAKAREMIDFEIGEIYQQLRNAGYGHIDEGAETAIQRRNNKAHNLI